MKFLILLIVIPFAGLSQDNNSKNDSTSGPPEKFLMVEKTAEFPGGIGKFYKYILKNLRYPEEAKRNGVEGKVYVEFVINQDGSIDDKSIRALSPDELSKFPSSTPVNFDLDCQNEAIRLLKGCPDWKPATIKKKSVRQRMILPIAFKI